MHYFDRLVRQLVGFDDSWVQVSAEPQQTILKPTAIANHLDDQPTFTLIWAILQANFTAIDGKVSVARISNASLEDGHESLDFMSDSELEILIWSVKKTLFRMEHVKRPSLLPVSASNS